MGGARAAPESADYRDGLEIGAGIARRGGIVLCGGRSGVMEAAARGAFEAGGEVIAILPGNDTSQMNEFVTIPVVTGIGWARNNVNVLTAGAVIAVGGNHGTLSEIALALLSHPKVVGLNTWRLIRPDGTEDDGVIRVGSATEAVERAFALLGTA